MGWVPALYMFVSNATNKCFPFFKTLKQAFKWTKECKISFKNLKEYLSKPPFLSPSIKGKNLYLYLAVSQTVVSLALIREENRVQRPVYYLSQAFQDAKAKYPSLEKASFAFIVASRNLHHRTRRCGSHHDISW